MSHDHDEPHMTIPNSHMPWTRAGAFAARAAFRCFQRFPRPFGGGISIGPHSASTCTQNRHQTNDDGTLRHAIEPFGARTSSVPAADAR